MPRLGKKTLYLDLDALDRLEAALHRLPGKPSLSSWFNESLPSMAETMEKMVAAAERGGLRGMADMLGIATSQVDELEVDVKKTIQEVQHPDRTIPEMIEAIPPKKTPKPRAKKVSKT